MRDDPKEVHARKVSYVDAIKDFINNEPNKDLTIKKIWAAGLSYGQTEEGYKGIKSDIAKIESSYPQLKALLLSIVTAIDEERHRALECNAFSKRVEKAALAREQANQARGIVEELQNKIEELYEDLGNQKDPLMLEQVKQNIRKSETFLKSAETKARILWEQWRTLEATAIKPTVGDRYIVAKRDTIPIGTKGIIKRVWHSEHGLRVLLHTEHGTDQWISLDKLNRF